MSLENSFLWARRGLHKFRVCFLSRVFRSVIQQREFAGEVPSGSLLVGCGSKALVQ
jgi:hypothetical protein